MKNFFLKNPAKVMLGVALVLVLAFAAVATDVQAQRSPVAPPPNSGITSVTGVYVLIDSVFNILFWLLIVLAAIFILWAAFSYLTAGGEAEKIQAANKKVIYAVVAVVVAVLARTIPTVICNFVSEQNSQGCANVPGRA